MDTLNEKAKRMSDNYGRLIFSYKSLGTETDGSDPIKKLHSSLQFKTRISLNRQNDETFYEDIIKIYTKALRKAFYETEKWRVEEEIARLFRSNAFNKNKREHAQERKEERYPVLKETALGKAPEEAVNIIGQKVSLPK